jgi:hypothetical protein
MCHSTEFSSVASLGATADRARSVERAARGAIANPPPSMSEEVHAWELA